MVHWTGVFQEGVHGCSENAHFLDPGSWDGGWGLALMIPSVWMIGILPLLLGVGLYLWCAGAFTFIGKGTPAPIDARDASWSLRDSIGGFAIRGTSPSFRW